MSENRENNTPENENIAENEPQGLPEEVEGGGGVAAGVPLEEVLESATPRWDQDEGQIQDPQSDRNSRKERVGVVVSSAADKTVTVKVERLVQHKLYKKRLRRSKKFMAHDEQNEAQLGDTVRIVETRPLSRRKRWRLARIVTKAQ